MSIKYLNNMSFCSNMVPCKVILQENARKFKAIGEKKIENDREMRKMVSSRPSSVAGMVGKRGLFVLFISFLPVKKVKKSQIIKIYSNMWPTLSQH